MHLVKWVTDQIKKYDILYELNLLKIEQIIIKVVLNC